MGKWEAETLVFQPVDKRAHLNNSNVTVVAALPRRRAAQVGRTTSAVHLSKAHAVVDAFANAQCLCDSTKITPQLNVSREERGRRLGPVADVNDRPLMGHRRRQGRVDSSDKNSLKRRDDVSANGNQIPRGHSHAVFAF